MKSLVTCVLLVTAFCGMALCQNQGHARTKRAQPIEHNVYTLDHFIELVEKIERHKKTSLQGLMGIAQMIRNMAGYVDDLWKILLGTSTPLPVGVLTTEERNALVKMTKHQFNGLVEEGVVRIGNDTIAMGPVILGIIAGISRKSRVYLDTWSSDAEDPVDNLFTSTIAGDLARTGLRKANDANRALFGPGGTWNSLPCSSTYTVTTSQISDASDALLLGDVDGFLLGYGVSKWAKKGVRLGQLLRMYYSNGVCYDETFQACNRYTKLKSILSVSQISHQTSMFSYAFYYKNKASLPKVGKEQIYNIAKETAKNFFPQLETIHKNKDCTQFTGGQDCELPANLVFVMDESGSIKTHNYAKEKTFVTKVIDAFDISPYQTRVAVVTFSTDPRLEVKLSDYGSKSRLQCSVSRLPYRKGSTHTAKAINMANDEILGPAQGAAATEGGAQGSVVPIMVLLTDGKSNDQGQNTLKNAVKRINNDISGLISLAVGVGSNIEKSELQLIASDPDVKHVFYAGDFDQLIRLVKSIQKTTCDSPLEMELDFRPGANHTVISAFVSPKRPRYFVLPSSWFYGIPDIVIDVTPVYGTVAIYASRKDPTPGPDSYLYKIDPLSVGETMKLRVSDPCHGYNRTDCPPIYLAVYGGDAEFNCAEESCIVPSQIKFRINQGVWSSSSLVTPLGLFSYLLAAMIVALKHLT